MKRDRLLASVVAGLGLLTLFSVPIWLNRNDRLGAEVLKAESVPMNAVPARGEPDVPNRLPGPTSSANAAPVMPSESSSASVTPRAELGAMGSWISRAVNETRDVLNLDWDAATTDAVMWVTYQQVERLVQRELAQAIVTDTAENERLIEIPGDAEFAQALQQTWKRDLREVVPAADFDIFQQNLSHRIFADVNGWGTHSQDILVRWDAVGGLYRISHRTVVDLSSIAGLSGQVERSSGSALRPNQLFRYEPYAKLFPPALPAKRR